MTIDQMIKMDAIIDSETAKIKGLHKELVDIKEKMLAYKIKRIKEKFPDIEINGKISDFKNIVSGSYDEGLRRALYTIRDAKVRNAIFKFTERCIEGVEVDDDHSAEVNLYFDPVYKEMVEEEYALQKTIKTRSILLDRAKKFEHAGFQESLLRREELALEIERLNNQTKDVEQTIDSSKKDYFLFKEAYQQLKNEYNCKD